MLEGNDDIEILYRQVGFKLNEYLQKESDMSNAMDHQRCNTQ